MAKMEIKGGTGSTPSAPRQRAGVYRKAAQAKVRPSVKNPDSPYRQYQRAKAEAKQAVKNLTAAEKALGLPASKKYISSDVPEASAKRMNKTAQQLRQAKALRGYSR